MGVLLREWSYTNSNLMCWEQQHYLECFNYKSKYSIAPATRLHCKHITFWFSFHFKTFFNGRGKITKQKFAFFCALNMIFCKSFYLLRIPKKKLPETKLWGSRADSGSRLAKLFLCHYVNILPILQNLILWKELYCSMRTYLRVHSFCTTSISFSMAAKGL